jgi:hypothetical protein
MAERLAFLLGKDPATSLGGDMTMFRALQSIAEEKFDTEIICLSDQPDRVDADIARVPKPPLALPRLAMASMAARRSLLHVRFDVDGLVAAVENSSADRFVAFHCHLAEPYLRSAGASPSEDLLVSTEILESKIWPLTHGLPGRLESRRLRRDEQRIVAAARAVAGYDRDDIVAFQSSGHEAHWIPLTLPPTTPVDVAATAPRIVMLGNRLWRPNAEAADTMVRLWPRIAAGLPDAELWLVGHQPARPHLDLPAGVIDHGMVDDVDAVLSQCRVLTAPVTVGGGVRVKLLEAAARGIPVVCSPEAVGSIEASINMTPAVDVDDFVAQCRALLVDVDRAADDGSRLHDTNAERWNDRVPQEAVLRWLAT